MQISKERPIRYKNQNYLNIDDCSQKTGKKRAVIRSLIRKGVIVWADAPVTLQERSII